MKISKSLAALSLIALLGGCGGESNKISKSAASATTLPVSGGAGASASAGVSGASNTFHGLVVPPDPGAAATATVAGVDMDNNGIRDEVDRHIAQIYGAKPIKFAAAQAVARADQLLLVTPTTDVTAATAAVHASLDAGDCLVKKFENNPIAAIRISNDITPRTFNTIDRQKQLRAVSSKVSLLTRSTEKAICL